MAEPKISFQGMKWSFARDDAAIEKMFDEYETDQFRDTN